MQISIKKLNITNSVLKMKKVRKIDVLLFILLYCEQLLLLTFDYLFLIYSNQFSLNPIKKLSMISYTTDEKETKGERGDGCTTSPQNSPKSHNHLRQLIAIRFILFSLFFYSFHERDRAFGGICPFYISILPFYSPSSPLYNTHNKAPYYK